MNILICAGNDAANQQLRSTVRALAQNHTIKILGARSDMEYFDMPFSMYGGVVGNASVWYKWADCVLATPSVVTNLVYCPKYVFMLCHMNPNFDEVRGYDFVLTHSPIRQNSEKGIFASMPVGNGKSDYFSAEDGKIQSDNKNLKRILYIDAGHFVFGRAGRDKIADMLLNISEKYPEYELYVRPRWKHGAKGTEMSHINFYHIFDAIDNACKKRGMDKIPDNIIYGTTAESLAGQINESDLVITSATSSYMDAAFAKKPILIIKGMENEDMYHERNAYLENLYAFMEKSGCVVDVDRILDYLPNGIICNENHIHDMVSYSGNVAERVVSVVEYVYNNYIAKSVYPDAKEYSYEDMSAITANDNRTMDDLTATRLFIANQITVILNHKVSRTVDWEDMNLKIMDLCRNTARKNSKLVKSKIEQVKYDFISRKAVELEKDDVTQSFVIYSLYKRREYDRVGEMLEAYVDNERFSAFYSAYLLHLKGEKNKALDMFEKYLRYATYSDFPKFICERRQDAEKVFKLVFSDLTEQKDFEKINVFLSIFCDFAYRYPSTNYYGMLRILIRFNTSDGIDRMLRRRLYEYAVKQSTSNLVRKAVNSVGGIFGFVK